MTVYKFTIKNKILYNGFEVSYEKNRTLERHEKLKNDEYEEKVIDIYDEFMKMSKHYGFSAELFNTVADFDASVRKAALDMIIWCDKAVNHQPGKMNRSTIEYSSENLKAMLVGQFARIILRSAISLHQIDKLNTFPISKMVGLNADLISIKVGYPYDDVTQHPSSDVIDSIDAWVKNKKLRELLLVLCAFINKEPRDVKIKFTNNMDEVFYAETISKEELPAVPAFCNHKLDNGESTAQYNHDNTATCILCGARIHLMGPKLPTYLLGINLNNVIQKEL